MKKIIRWLADVSGVTEEIRIQSNKTAGGQMYHNAFWFSGDAKLFNAFMLYSKWLRLGWHSPICEGMSEVRTKVKEYGDVRMTEQQYDPQWPL
jgi:hypothetical protein